MLFRSMIEIKGGKGTIEKRIPAMMRMFGKHGIDIRTEPILVYPTLHYQNGGLHITPDGQTDVENLFAAGEVVGGIHGRNRLMGTLLCLTLFLKRWQPVRVFRFGDLGASQVDMTLAHTGYTAGQVLRAWTPFLFLTATVTLWSIPPFKALFASGGALYEWVINIPVPYLDKLVARMPPVVSEATAYAAVFKFDWFSATGTAILFAALLSIVWLKMKPSDAISTFGSTLKELALPIYSIGMVLAFAFISNYSGLSSTLALALAHTGHAFTFFSPFLGWLGVFLTGSDTSSNALFAALQATAAQQIGVSDLLLVAANTTGGVTGKMISPQSIAIACAAVGLVGKESDLFRFTVKHSLIFTCMVGVITTLQAYVLTWMIP